MDKEIEYNEIIAKEKPKRLKSLLVFKIIGTIAYSLATIPFVIFIISMLVDLAGSEDGLGKGIGKALFIILVVSFAAICALIYLVPIILGIVGLIRTKKKLEKGKRTGNIVYFTLMISVPVVSLVLEICSAFLTYLI